MDRLGIDSKICKNCLEEKPIIRFQKNAQLWDKHMNRCKDCTRFYNITGANYVPKNKPVEWLEAQEARLKEYRPRARMGRAPAKPKKPHLTYAKVGQVISRHIKINLDQVNLSMENVHSILALKAVAQELNIPLNLN